MLGLRISLLMSLQKDVCLAISAGQKRLTALCEEEGGKETEVKIGTVHLPAFLEARGLENPPPAPPLFYVVSTC